MIGLRDDVYGEEVVAVVVPRVDADFPPEEEFIAWSREHLGAHKYPRQVFTMESLPMGPSQKVLKRELRRILSEK